MTLVHGHATRPPVGAVLWPEEHVAVHGDPLHRQPIDIRSKAVVDMIVNVEVTQRGRTKNRAHPSGCADDLNRLRCGAVGIGIERIAVRPCRATREC